MKLLLAFWTEKNFDLGLLSLSLVSPKFIWAPFTQPHGINIYIQDSFPLAFWSQTYVYMCLLFLGLVSPKYIWARFAQPHGTNIPVGSISLGHHPELIMHIYFPLHSAPLPPLPLQTQTLHQKPDP